MKTLTRWVLMFIAVVGLGISVVGCAAKDKTTEGGTNTTHKEHPDPPKDHPAH